MNPILVTNLLRDGMRGEKGTKALILSHPNYGKRMGTLRVKKILLLSQLNVSLLRKTIDILGK